MRQIELSFSTCPNDTFIFDALVNGKIDTRGYSFNVELFDIEELNNLAQSGAKDVIKVSYALYNKIKDSYTLLRSGGAMGYGNGPLLVCAADSNCKTDSNLSVALPGRDTTATALLKRLFPEVEKRSYHLFSDITNRILSNEVDAGVLIHEERFLYKERGLKLMADLGEEWERQYNLPIPLGGIVAKRSLNDDWIEDIDNLIKESVLYALNNPSSSREYIKRYAKELSNEVIDKHIDMFVNDFSVDIGEKGYDAICAITSFNN